MDASSLPAPVRGMPLRVETDAGRVTGYELGKGRTVLLLHSFNAAGCGAELAALATRLAAHRRVVLVDWLGFGTSERPDERYDAAFYVSQLDRVRALQGRRGQETAQRLPKSAGNALWPGLRTTPHPRLPHAADYAVRNVVGATWIDDTLAEDEPPRSVHGRPHTYNDSRSEPAR